MKKLTSIFLTLIILSLAACSASPTAASASATQNGTGGLPITTLIALGTFKLDGTDNAITADQAAELLPLWETMKVLESSDTAAQQEIEALGTQIQETMTDQQMQAITAMNLTRQDMFSVMQAQGTAPDNGQQNSTSQNGSSSENRNFGGGFGPGTGGPPPEERAFSGGQGFGGQGQNRSAEQIATAQAARQAGGGNRIPTPLVNALIEFLQKKAGS